MTKSENAIENFTRLSDTLLNNLSDLMHFYSDSSSSYKDLQKEKEKLISGLEKGEILIGEGIDEKALVEAAKRIKARVDQYSDTISLLSVIYSIAHFEAFLTDILKELLLLFPQSMKTSKKQLTYEEIFNHMSDSNLIDAILEKEIIEFSFLNIAEQIKFIQKKFNIALATKKESGTSKEINLERLIELFSARNIILHNNSIVNRKYLQDNPHSSLKLGEKISFKGTQAYNVMMFLIHVGETISNGCTEKIKHSAK